ncbi:MAG TPA: hypothetical protein VGJ93_03470 [Desulfuromonadaceae bacterium]
MKKLRLATAWLSGCSGCHMSLLNLHAGLLELFEKFELVYSPLADTKQYPEQVDIALVEGAVSNEDNLVMARLIRDKTKIVVSLGDCAVNGNVTALRNPSGKNAAFEAAYPGCNKGACFGPDVPKLFDVVLPLHQVIMIDAFIPGCPPGPETIALVLGQLAAQLQPGNL